MRKEDYDDMHALESDYWWFAGMRRITFALLKRHLPGGALDFLDVGCGTGINLLQMCRDFPLRRAVGCDFSSIALAWCRDTIRNAPAHPRGTVPRLSRGDVRSLPFADASFDLVTSLDVLDVFDPNGEDEKAFAELHRVLRPGGVAFFREPAYRWLLSSHDTLFDTRHRYTTGELRRKISKAGFRIAGSTYANTLLFPLAAGQRLLRRFAGICPERTDTQPWPPHLQWLNRPFEACLALEAVMLSKGWSLPFGLSAICIGIKPPV